VNLAIAGIRKFRTRTATIVSLIVAVILVVLEFVLVGVSYRSATATTATSSGVDKATFDWLLTFPGAYEAVLALAFEFLGIIGLIYVVTASGSEWTWGTLKVAVARGQSRWQYTVATFASLGFILLIGLLITFAAGVAAAAVGGSIAGLPIGNPADPSELAQVLVKLARAWIALMGLTSLGYAVAMVTRSQMAGIGTVIGYFIVSIIGPALLPDFVKEAFKYLPFSIAADSVGLMAPSSSGAITSASAVEPNLALLVTIGWLVGCLLVASIFVERAEISG
jgi:ABC-type transport system involved in multi-copper enzyme maturation permease subunit